MPTPFFQFKQFTVYHDKCAMKVGTDGVLLGAWAEVEEATSALDVGTGTGLIALMLAQRNELLQICAIDIDQAAVLQARENVAATNWLNRIEVEQADFISYFPANKQFDLIVSNPPYFRDSLKSPNDSRTAARHTDSLGFNQLVKQAALLLAAKGRFCVVIPTDGMSDFLADCTLSGLFLAKRLLVCTKPGAAPKRVLLELRKAPVAVVNEEVLVVELARHQYSQEYIALTRQFYLKM